MKSNINYIGEKFRNALYYLAKTSGSRAEALKNYSKWSIEQFIDPLAHADRAPANYRKMISEICDIWNNDMTEETAIEICSKIADVAFNVTADIIKNQYKMPDNIL